MSHSPLPIVMSLLSLFLLGRLVLVVVQRRGVSAGSHGGQSGVVVVIGLGGVIGVLAGVVVRVSVVDYDPSRGGGRGVGLAYSRGGGKV